MKRFPFLFVVLIGGLLLMGADGCSSDPNVEGAKLDLRNKDYNRALENLDKALERNPNNAQALELRGRVLQAKAFDEFDVEAHTQLLQEMVDAFSMAEKVDPTLSGGIKTQLLMAYLDEFNRGIGAFQQGQNDSTNFIKAASYFKNSSMIQPDSTGPYINQAYALLNAGTPNAAIEPFEMALQKGDKTADSYIFLADLYRQAEQVDKIVPLLETAREVHPSNPDILAQLLNAYVQTGQEERARSVYLDAVNSEPDNKLYRYNYGSLLLELEDYDGAIVQLEKAVELDPDYTNANFNLGAAYVNKAVEISTQINESDDRLREKRGEMSDAEVKAEEAKMEVMISDRRQLFEQAIAPLEKAREATEAEGGETLNICQALFSAYVQTGQQEKAEALAACAGYENQ